MILHPGWARHVSPKDLRQPGKCEPHEVAGILQKLPNESSTYSSYKTYLSHQMNNLFLYHSLRKESSYLKREHRYENLLLLEPQPLFCPIDIEVLNFRFADQYKVTEVMTEYIDIKFTDFHLYLVN